MSPVTLLVVGCGSRGTTYSEFALRCPERARVVAVAEPRDEYRNALAERCGVPESMRFRSWQEAARLPKLADAVLICTLDEEHEAPAVAFADLGYAILLEKPMAPTEQACRNIVDAVKRNNSIFAVCHVLRYTSQTRKIQELIHAGRVGRLVSMQRLEPVRHWHQCHSFVRGNWRNSKETCFMLLAKCCHDLDWIRYVMGRPCASIHSFGSLFEFTAANKPAGAADRCVDCPAEIESMCPSSALKIYMRDRVARGQAASWPTDVLTTRHTPEGVADALRKGPYGRCVYSCDNDVVDNQVVNIAFRDGSTAQLLMTAFCNVIGRVTRIFGTRGDIYADNERITLTDFLTNQQEVFPSEPDDGTILSGHGGGDYRIMDDFIAAVANNDPSRILSDADETLESHLMCFKAEESRLTNKVISF